MIWLLLLVGLTILTAGAELLIRGASKLAAAAGVSPLVIGLTVVACGTSAPELAVSMKSAWVGQSDIALGNVVGSNICNVLLILGACAALFPLNVHSQLIRRDVPIMIVVSFLLGGMALNGVIGRLDGTILLTCMVLYTVYIIRKSRSESKAVQAEFAAEYAEAEKITARGIAINLILFTVGFAMLVFGARIFVDNAVAFAQSFGVSELVIGLTVVAVGTSLPEIATSIVATIRGERDIAIGNVVGSNIYNIVSVLGLTSIIQPVSVRAEALAFDIPIMIAIAVACLPIFFTGSTISRWEGLLFLGYYIAYTAYLILSSRAGTVPEIFTVAMLYFALPLTAITLAVLATMEWRKSRASGA